MRAREAIGAGCCAVGLAMLASGCWSGDGGADAPAGPATTATTATTAAAATDLAPSQLTAETVPTPTPAARCDPDRVAIEVVVPDAGPGQPDQVVELVNEGDRECDLDISATEQAAPEMEPSVRLGPGDRGLVWIEGLDSCSRPEADPVLVLDLNGTEREVAVVVDACEVAVTAFFTE